MSESAKITSEELDFEVSKIAQDNLNRDEPDIDALFGKRMTRSEASHRKVFKKNHTSTTFSKYRGVRRRRKNTWEACITYKRRYISLGSFDNEIDAAKAYDRAARLIFRDSAMINFEED